MQPAVLNQHVHGRILRRDIASDGHHQRNGEFEVCAGDRPEACDRTVRDSRCRERVAEQCDRIISIGKTTGERCQSRPPFLQEAANPAIRQRSGARSRPPLSSARSSSGARTFDWGGRTAGAQSFAAPPSAQHSSEEIADQCIHRRKVRSAEQRRRLTLLRGKTCSTETLEHDVTTSMPSDAETFPAPRPRATLRRQRAPAAGRFQAHGIAQRFKLS